MEKTELVPRDEDAMKIIRLFLEKVEILSPREREVLIKTIDWLNNPLFISHT